MHIVLRLAAELDFGNCGSTALVNLNTLRRADEMQPVTTLPRVLFVCVENSNRSQMAEAFARMHGAGVVEAFSAGSRPSGQINPRAVAAMKERGYDLTSHRSTGLDAISPGPYAAVVTMGCGDACPWVPAKMRVDWELPDPRAMEPAEFNAVRDEIERRVRALLAELRAAA